MNKNNKNSGGGLGFSSVLQIVFIVLKLCGVINWKWVWVLSPTWISLSLVVIAVLLYGIIAMVERKHRK